MKQSWTDAIKLAKRVAYLQSAQEQCGIGFDRLGAERLLVRITEEMAALEAQVLPQLPMRKLKKAQEAAYTLPKKPFKMDGSWSELMLRFAARHGIELHDDRTFTWEGQRLAAVGGLQLDKKMPMQLGEQQDLKEWLLSEGWVPTLYNFKRGPDGKPERDPKTKELIRTTPKMQENGRLCPNLEAMQGDLVKLVVKWFSYRNRKSVLEGWLGNRRLELDGRLTAAASGITNTFRMKHTVVANVPKNKEHVLLGKEFRSLFVAHEGDVLVGYDASSLEDRIKGHFTSKFDGGAYAAKILAEGYDPHQENADLWNIDRSIAKNGTYALGYFCGVKKLASTIKCNPEDAAKHHEAYWDLNDALRQLDEALGRHWEANGKKYIVGLDGRKVYSRHRHGLVNLLIQSSGSILMDFAGAWMDRKLGGLKLVDNYPTYVYNGYRVKRVLFVHDEYGYSCNPAIASSVLELGKMSIRKAGEFFKLRVPLESSGSVGTNWSELK